MDKVAILVNLSPLAITLARLSNVRLALLRLFVDYVLLVPAVYFLSNLRITNFLVIFGTLFVMLHSLYEVIYILNDLWTVRYEYYPTKRSYVRILNAPIAVGIRIFYFILLTFLMDKLVSLLTSTSLLLLIALMHNLQRNNLMRTPTSIAVRLIRFLFIPMIMFDLNPAKIQVILVILLPYVLAHSVESYGYRLNKAGITIPDNVPTYYWFGIFIPIQLVLTNWNIACLSGNILLMILSFLKHITQRARK